MGFDGTPFRNRHPVRQAVLLRLQNFVCAKFCLTWMLHSAFTKALSVTDIPPSASTSGNLEVLGLIVEGVVGQLRRMTP